MNRTTRHTLTLACAASLLLALGVADAAAKTKAAKAPYDVQYDVDKKAAGERYSADKKLCDEERTSATRMQCKRDANSEYRKALAAAQKKRDEAKKRPAAKPVAAVAPAAATATAAAVPAPAATCKECGKVTAIRTGEKEGKGGPVGVIAGGVAGAVLGHQVGGGSGKDLATIAGAAGGAYAGHKIEEKMTAAKYWAVSVRFETGEERSFTFDHDPNFAVGDSVQASGGSIVRH